MRDVWRWDEPEQIRSLWRTVCGDKECGWEDDVTHLYLDDCNIIECPECGTSHIIDSEEDADEA